MLTLKVFIGAQELSFNFPEEIHWNFEIRFNDAMNPNDAVVWITSLGQILADYPEVVRFHQKIRSYDRSSITNIQLYRNSELVFDSSRLQLIFDHTSLQLNDSIEIDNNNDNNGDYHSTFRFLITFLAPLTQEGD